MKPPGPFTWLIGNAVISLVLMVGGVAVVGMWLMGTANGWAAFGAAMLASLAARASEKVRAHAAWEREWNGRGGGVALSRNWRMLLGMAAWAWLAWLSLLPAEGDPTLQVASGLFWLASVLMVVVGAARFARARIGRRAPKQTMVKVCLRVPLRSPSVQEAYGALPTPRG
jgi:hypothetical protein